MTLFTLSPFLLRGLACAVWLAVLIALTIRRPAWRTASGGVRLMLAGLAVVGAGLLIGAAFTALHRSPVTPDRVAMEAVALIAGGLALAGILRYRPVGLGLPALSGGAPSGSLLSPDVEEAGRKAVEGVVERSVAGVMVAALDAGTATSGPVVYANPAAQGWLRRIAEGDAPPTLAGLFAAAGRGELWPSVAGALGKGHQVCEVVTLPTENPDQPGSLRLTLAPVSRDRQAGRGEPDLVLATLAADGRDEATAFVRFQSEREAAMSRLAAGLAHDFSNVLTVVLTASEILLLEEGLPDPLRRRIERMHGAAQRGADLTDRLRAFAGRLDLMEEELDLHAFLRAGAVEFKTVLGPDIELHYDLADGPCPVSLDPDRMRAALASVLGYCRSVLPEGGRVGLHTQLRATAGQEGAPPDAVALCISRSGTHMPIADARRLLEEPYSGGSSSVPGGGFGLSLVAGFIRQSGGRARFVNETGQRLILEIELPLVAPSGGDGAEAESAMIDTGTAAPAPAPASLHVLVVDDNDLMREAAVAELAALGCTATLAATADEALASLEADSSITAVLSDLGLEGARDGLWLARRVDERFPGLRVVLMTGDMARARQADDPRAVLLPKPFTLAQLAEALGLPPRETRHP